MAKPLTYHCGICREEVGTSCCTNLACRVGYWNVRSVSPDETDGIDEPLGFDRGDALAAATTLRTTMGILACGAEGVISAWPDLMRAEKARRQASLTEGPVYMSLSEVPNDQWPDGGFVAVAALREAEIEREKDLTTLRDCMTHIFELTQERDRLRDTIACFRKILSEKNGGARAVLQALAEVLAEEDRP